MIIREISENEFTFDVNGYSFHIIIGEYINGNYIAIINFGVCFPAAKWTDVKWNYEQMVVSDDDVIAANALNIAIAVQKFVEYKGENA